MINTECTYWNGKFLVSCLSNQSKEEREKEWSGGVTCSRLLHRSAGDETAQSQSAECISNGHALGL